MNGLLLINVIYIFLVSIVDATVYILFVNDVLRDPACKDQLSKERTKLQKVQIRRYRLRLRLNLYIALVFSNHLILALGANLSGVSAFALVNSCLECPFKVFDRDKCCTRELGSYSPIGVF